RIRERGKELDDAVARSTGRSCVHCNRTAGRQASRRRERQREPCPAGEEQAGRQAPAELRRSKRVSTSFTRYTHLRCWNTFNLPRRSFETCARASHSSSSGGSRRPVLAGRLLACCWPPPSCSL
ncbi:unnamed protein product, partial [Ectocarpus sp. 12 AP-2014]